MSFVTRRLAGFLTAISLLAAGQGGAFAQKKYDTGATDTEIKIGNIMPYSGPLSAWGAIGKTEAAYFQKINSEGGINGRKITFISYDDAFSPPKTVEQARKLVESDGVLLIFQSLGGPTNAAIQKYMNTRKVPQLFVATGEARWNDPQNFPWTMGWQPNLQNEARIYAKYILKEKPDARIGILYENNDFGKDFLKGLKNGLGDRAASLIVAEDAYDVTEPTIDSHIVKMKTVNADVFLDITTPKFAAQAIRKAAEIGWKPLHILSAVSVSVGVVMKPAGIEAAQGIISSAYLKDPTDPQWKNDRGMKAWNEFLDKYYRDANRSDVSVIYAYAVAQTLEHVLRACGDDLTRENVMKQAANIRDLELDGLLPGIKINTSATDFAPISQRQMIRFKGETWERFGEIVDADVGG
ncbi:ABC transporter substrate-binding protein [Bradyrhizobium sp. Arg68]|uniref:ABC transporter substrate-binding protein n=1 Tax=Bradyrhizobium ivorense TaxID=2511166 RepID=UPI001E5ED28D|nr:ABC transporter substrate-binding protein [Bradyrhizobium ivorense]MCC8938989.1 ABC transporter substrate-binding protein [Bradyrhizobium ivorense]